MAKKSKAKAAVMDSCCAVPSSDYKPRLYIDLDDQDVAQLKGLKIGEKGQVLVTGKIVGIEQRQNADGGKTKTRGSIQFESFDVEVLGDEDNPFIDLAKDED